MKASEILFRELYMPVCRAYSRNIVKDNPADAIYRFLCSIQFWRTHRFWPDFVHPRRFTEKLWSRMLHDRDPLLTVIYDKLRVREYVAGKVGTDILVPLLWSGETPEQIPFDQLPSRFVIKATHGCEYNIFIKDKTQIDERKIRLQLAQWLRQNYCNDFLIGIEWFYRNIKPSIIIEEFLEENGKAPIDYKFFCFSGRVELITIHFNRFEKHATIAVNRDFSPREFRYQFDQYAGKLYRPLNYETMLDIVESLAEGFDFIRVDLYNLNGIIIFGELTRYPGGVTVKVLPEIQDYLLGEKWEWE